MTSDITLASSATDLHTVPTILFTEWDSLTRAEQWRHRQRARYMRLKPDSLRTLPSAAQAFADAVMNNVIIPHKATSLTTPLRPTTRQDLAAALGVWLAELFYAAAWGNWTATSLRRVRFKGLAVGHQAFTDCKTALEQARLIVAIRGWSAPDHPQGNMSPMFRPTPALLEIAERHGVTAGGVADHFALEDPEAA